MICLGHSDADKLLTVNRYRAEHEIDKVVIISPSRFSTLNIDGADVVEYDQVIKYKVFYRLLQEINQKTLIVINECLRTQNRHDLTYNCIRQYLNQTPHSVVFQYLPIIDTFNDFMVLVDFVTQSRWKRENFSTSVLEGVQVRIVEQTPRFTQIPVKTTAVMRTMYQKEKRKLIDGIGLRDPHTIPRNLYLVGGKAKAAAVESGTRYLGRNTRLKIPNLVTYREDRYEGQHTVLELCHNMIDFADFLTLSRQRDIAVMVADLKVDRWYFDRFTAWSERIQNAYTTIQG